MSHADWHARWRENRIGFHKDAVNSNLQAWWPALGVPADGAVFVPLCGKSVDMHWLAERGHAVFGIELSSVAVRDFFAEADLAPVQGEINGMSYFEHGRIRIFCGDFFALSADMLGPVSGCFDRASLIALAPQERPCYMRHLATLLPQSSRCLLVALDYPQAEMKGPPFSVPPSEVRALCADLFAVETLSDVDVLAHETRFRERGVSRMREQCYRLTRESPG